LLPNIRGVSRLARFVAENDAGSWPPGLYWLAIAAERAGLTVQQAEASRLAAVGGSYATVGAELGVGRDRAKGILKRAVRLLSGHFPKVGNETRAAARFWLECVRNDKRAQAPYAPLDAAGKPYGLDCHPALWAGSLRRARPHGTVAEDFLPEGPAFFRLPGVVADLQAEAWSTPYGRRARMPAATGDLTP
jgi:hypothetical protein